MIPFKAGIDAGADLVMFGHLRYSAVDTVPASLSKKWHTILRNTLGFKGLAITDDMIMLQNSGDGAYMDPVSNAVSAIEAGNDLLLFVLDHGDPASQIDPNTLIDGVVAAVQRGQMSESVINDHARAVLGVRHSIATSNDKR
jgi:beta-N-acetylhexosaminidase